MTYKKKSEDYLIIRLEDIDICGAVSYIKLIYHI